MLRRSAVMLLDMAAAKVTSESPRLMRSAFLTISFTKRGLSVMRKLLIPACVINF